MKLLICTQAIDRSDPVLGFFHRWVEELAKQAEHIHIICLKEGEHALPQNVRVHSLGKEHGASKLKYIARFYRYIVAFQDEYDAVFVHMNQEYVLMGGIFWRLFGKRIVLWRNHKKGSWQTRIAAFLAHRVCFTSPDAHVSAFTNAQKMPIGIDTAAFQPSGNTRYKNTILFLGRLDAVKHPDVFLEALAQLSESDVDFSANVYGDPTPGRESYAEGLRERFKSVKGVSFLPAVRNDETPAIYAAHTLYVNLTPSGSFDKTIGEAMASGCLVVAANDALRDVLPEELIVNPDDPQSVARAIRAALDMDDARQNELARQCRAYIEREHSLSLLTLKLASILSK